ncbi:MAG TPA: hypothetical protein VFH27_14785 [Longimicrobiaceae bacterium]|nr:hypothetical protein [Longimicrobiaceae bacterium]
MASLLAVDVGLRTGLALYGGDGRLLWYRSQNFGTAERLRRGVHGVIAGLLPHLGRMVVEGGGNLAEIWEKEAARRGVAAVRIPAEVWRERLLLPRDRRSGAQAKHTADEAARRVIEWSGAPRATSLRHDAAEAILVGLWGVMDAGWLEALPAALRP